MQDYKNLELSDLFDLLTQKTSEYMKMLSGGATQEAFEDCREEIINVQMEIVSRKINRTGQPGRNPEKLPLTPGDNIAPPGSRRS